MAFYDSKPSIFEANNNGSYMYRWNIREVEIASGMNNNEAPAPIVKWECDEVVVWGTVTKDKITEKVITALWPNDYEKKLINDYNAAKEGVFSTEASAEYIARYKSFLSDRKAIKEQIDADCITLKIQ